MVYEDISKAGKDYAWPDHASRHQAAELIVALNDTMRVITQLESECITLRLKAMQYDVTTLLDICSKFSDSCAEDVVGNEFCALTGCSAWNGSECNAGSCTEGDEFVAAFLKALGKQDYKSCMSLLDDIRKV